MFLLIYLSKFITIGMTTTDNKKIYTNSEKSLRLYCKCKINIDLKYIINKNKKFCNGVFSI